MPGELQQHRRRQEADLDLIYEVDEAWDEHLHGLLGAAWPCPRSQRLDQIVADIHALLAAKGLGSGGAPTAGIATPRTPCAAPSGAWHGTPGRRS